MNPVVVVDVNAEPIYDPDRLEVDPSELSEDNRLREIKRKKNRAENNRKRQQLKAIKAADLIRQQLLAEPHDCAKKVSEKEANDNYDAQQLVKMNDRMRRVDILVTETLSILDEGLNQTEWSGWLYLLELMEDRLRAPLAQREEDRLQKKLLDSKKSCRFPKENCLHCRLYPESCDQCKLCKEAAVDFEASERKLRRAQRQRVFKEDKGFIVPAPPIDAVVVPKWIRKIWYVQTRGPHKGQVYCADIFIEITFTIPSWYINPDRTNRHAFEKLLEDSFRSFGHVSGDVIPIRAKMGVIEYTSLGTPHLHGVVRYGATIMSKNKDEAKRRFKAATVGVGHSTLLNTAKGFESEVETFDSDHIPIREKNCRLGKAKISRLITAESIHRWADYLMKEPNGVKWIVGGMKDLLEDIPSRTPLVSEL